MEKTDPKVTCKIDFKPVYLYIYQKPNEGKT